MMPIGFPQSNILLSAPEGMEESQVGTIPAFRGTMVGGPLDGVDISVVAWLPTPEEKEAIATGSPIYLSVIGGLPPHFLSVTFPYTPPEG